MIKQSYILPLDTRASLRTHQNYIGPRELSMRATLEQFFFTGEEFTKNGADGGT